MIATADLHIHSLFSMAASKNTSPDSLLNACLIKGIDVLGSGDALHPVWREMWMNNLENSQNVTVIPSAEVEGKGKVHHLILMEDFEQAKNIADIFRMNSKNIDKAGRPNVSLTGEKIAEIVHNEGAMIGPAHAFTPWTGLYGRYDSTRECYGEEKIDFLELGLSADTSYGEGIPEIDGITFLSNSDAHSALLNKLGREFNRIDIRSKKTADILKSIKDGQVTLNAGFFPEEGKYNQTACTRCYKHYSLEKADLFSWKCPEDGGKIKMGVYDRAMKMSDNSHKKCSRPPYIHIIPLGDIIQKVLGLSSPNSKRCQVVYEELIENLGTEINILLDVPYDEIFSCNEKIASAIKKFREGNLRLYPGGGGMYGSFDLS
ncbi:endonuclease Q family protein [Methanoplanus sp. FWC-SCC4]|uniref:Endonuclease Q family protein n=1 Tax=Methanochimaera problematica TaxID=2609417 RepID=A0AA97FC72_9EURY|nr:endonuclease Q family protein [Methanoplanus sp. FWC-SCC4]WOF15842.1 endonuclease Q family protein [Methanoplanus sp. FWC-SCC4]